MTDEVRNDLTSLTVQLLSAFVSKNTVQSDDLAALIKTTRAALTEDLSKGDEPAAPELTPAVSIRKSLSSPDHIISLIDGKSYKTLKRHLAMHGLTEKTYRERYNLPASYPMVAPSYSNARRAVAQRLGLGRKLSATAGAKPSSPENDAAKLASSNARDNFRSSETSKANGTSTPKPARKKLSIATPGGTEESSPSAAKPVQSKPKMATRAAAKAKPASNPQSLETTPQKAADPMSAGIANQQEPFGATPVAV